MSWHCDQLYCATCQKTFELKSLVWLCVHCQFEVKSWSAVRGLLSQSLNIYRSRSPPRCLSVVVIHLLNRNQCYRLCKPGFLKYNYLTSVWEDLLVVNFRAQQYCLQCREKYWRRIFLRWSILSFRLAVIVLLRTIQNTKKDFYPWIWLSDRNLVGFCERTKS